jgi:hypothetical protein
MEASNQGKTRNCTSCGRAISWDANVCQYCGKDYRAEAQVAPKKHSVMPLIGGVFIIIAGAIEIYYGAVLITGGAFFANLPIIGDTMQNILTACGAILAILGIVAILGGAFALMRKHHGLAILGGVLGLPGYFIFGLIGLILVAVSKEEFE